MPDSKFESLFSVPPRGGHPEPCATPTLAPAARGMGSWQGSVLSGQGPLLPLGSGPQGARKNRQNACWGARPRPRLPAPPAAQSPPPPSFLCRRRQQNQAGPISGSPPARKTPLPLRPRPCLTRRPTRVRDRETPAAGGTSAFHLPPHLPLCGETRSQEPQIPGRQPAGARLKLPPSARRRLHPGRKGRRSPRSGTQGG